MFKKLIIKLEKRIEKGLDQTGRPLFLTLEWQLQKISLLYRAIVRCRLFFYEKGWLKTRKLPCPVISVGNIAVGGTGKTPMAVFLAQTFIKMGKKPVVVSRGYKGEYNGNPLVVSDGKTVFCNADICGDEPFMMARRKEFPVVIGKNRKAAACMAIETLGCDIIILDDGFQHIKLERDVNLLLMDWENPLGNQRLLPAGRLREPVDTAMLRADAIVFTRAPMEDKKREKPGRSPVWIHPKKACFSAGHVPVLIQHIPAAGDHEKRFTDLSGLNGKKALLFSGIAGNHHFHRTAETMGMNIVSHLEFKDHYRYKRSDIENINHQAKILQADVIVTTEKDWVKLEPGRAWKTGVAVIGIDLCLHDADGLNAYLKAKLKFQGRTENKI